MREKISSLIKFIAVIAGLALIYYGLCGAYQQFFGVNNTAKAITDIIIAAVGVGVGVVGFYIGNLVNR